MIGYPYTYGDNKDFACSDVVLENNTLTKVLRVFLLAAVPTCGLAAENASIPVFVAEAVNPKNAPTAIGPVSAACCAAAGYCAHIAQTSYKKGDVKSATAAACGAVTFCCAQRAAQAYRL
jgi:hypothetical protein